MKLPSKQERPEKPAGPRIALITGASSGIGHALALALSQKGYELILFGRNEQALRELEKELVSPSRIVICDLACEAGRSLLAKTIHDRVPDLVINNAGIGFYGDESASEAEAIIDINCTALVEATHAATRCWRELGRVGTCLNVASALAFTPTPGMSVYAASKAFVLSFSLAEDTRYRQYGIRVLTSCPGRVVTAFGERASRGGRKKTANPFIHMSADHAAMLMLQQIEKQKTVSVIDWRTKLLIFLAKILPRSLVMHILAKNVQQRL
jgi:hypothetical protein